MTRPTTLLFVILATLATPPRHATAQATATPTQPGLAEPEPLATTEPDRRTIRIPNTTVQFELVRVPAGVVRTDDAEKAVAPLWVLSTEVTWDLYDVFVYALDEPEDGGDAGADADRTTTPAPPADAIARPSKPYVPPDRGFGHAGYPAMGMTRQGAERFCDWLQSRTGLKARLPTPAEWTHLAGADAPDDAALAQHAWTKANADASTHPVARKEPNANGLFDTRGNVAEWVMTDTRRPVAMGGSYRDDPEACTATSTQQQDASWNSSDPQIPKSRWWLADCSWVGFRFVVDDADAEPAREPPQHDESKEDIHEP